MLELSNVPDFQILNLKGLLRNILLLKSIVLFLCRQSLQIFLKILIE